MIFFSHLIIFFHQCVQTDRQHGHVRGKGGYALVGIKYTHVHAYQLKLFLEQFHVRSTVLNNELPFQSRMNIIEQYNAGNLDYLIALDDDSNNTDIPDNENDNDENDNDDNDDDATTNDHNNNNDDDDMLGDFVAMSMTRTIIFTVLLWIGCRSSSSSSSSSSSVEEEEEELGEEENERTDDTEQETARRQVQEEENTDLDLVSSLTEPLLPNNGNQNDTTATTSLSPTTATSRPTPTCTPCPTTTSTTTKPTTPAPSMFCFSSTHS